MANVLVPWFTLFYPLLPLIRPYRRAGSGARQGRILGATDEEVAAATKTVNGALRHPIMQRAVAAALKGHCRREVPIAVKLEGDLMVEGVVDLAFREETPDGSWTVIDYKTDFEVKGKLDEYRKQVGLYAFAISRATGEKLKRFCSECKVDENLTKAEASKRIDELQKKTGRGVNQDERQKAARFRRLKRQSLLGRSKNAQR